MIVLNISTTLKKTIIEMSESDDSFPRGFLCNIFSPWRFDLQFQRFIKIILAFDGVHSIEAAAAAMKRAPAWSILKSLKMLQV